VSVLPKLSSSLARYIGASVWRNGGDIRNVISIGKIVRKSDALFMLCSIFVRRREGYSWFQILMVEKFNEGSGKNGSTTIYLTAAGRWSRLVSVMYYLSSTSLFAN